MLLTPRHRPTTSRHQSLAGRHRLRAGLLVTASVTLLAAALPPAPVPLGIGDPLFPHLGNPGYDVTAYDIALTYKGKNTKPLDAVTTIDARATADLENINLDFARGTVKSVKVNGRPAKFVGKAEDLVITPVESVHTGERVRIVVTHTSDPTKGGDSGWLKTGDGLVMAAQADAAHRVFPCNDHPADKAYFTFHVTTPGTKLKAVTNGLPVSTKRSGPGGPVTATYRTSHPMATELAQVAIGDYTVVHRKGPGGLPLRDVVRTKDRKKLERWLKKTPDHLEWMSGKVGRYPFETYGLLVADAETGFELETQTLSLFERRLFLLPEVPEWYVESIMVHELAHHWFGNSVSPRTWSDLWLSEGHATWYEALFSEERAGRSMELRMRSAYGQSDRWRAAGGPGRAAWTAGSPAR